jgi:hypothetical protein
MRELLMTLVRYRGEYVAFGKNQAMRMMLGEAEQPQGWPMHSAPAYFGGVVSPTHDRGILRGIEALPDLPQGAD